MDHGGHDEGEAVAAGVQRVALLDQHRAGGEIHAQKLLHHGLDLGVADDLGLGIALQQQLLGGGVVRLHVLHHQVVQLAAVQGMGHILQKYAVHGLVHRVEEDGLLVEKQVRVIGNAVGHAVDALEAGKPPVVGADPDQILGHFSRAVHKCSLPPCGAVLFGLNEFII